MMAALALTELARELGADYAGPALTAAGVTTDSRRVAAGDLYVALAGERFDGHDFVAAAASAGAVAALVSRPVAHPLPQLRVDDTRIGLGLVARLNRRRFQGPLIGITGSAGKTTSKEMLAAILAGEGSVLATRGNLNNEIGVPLTLLALAPEHRYAVVEMGAGKVGDIDYLCRFAEPDIGLLTNAMPAHLEGFGSVAAVAETKGGLFAGLRAGGTAVINADDEYAPLWRRQAGDRRQLSFGLGNGAEVTARNVEHTPTGLRCELVSPAGSGELTLNLLGQHNLRNALGAAAAAIAAGAGIKAIRAGLAAVQAVPGRLQPRRALAGYTLIDDSYNANPGAVKAAIDVLAAMPGPRRLVLGAMAELGPTAEALHREVAAYAAARGIESLWCVGEWAQAQAAAFGANGRAFADRDELIEAGRHDAAATVLVKGSRSAGMDRVVAAWCGDAAAGEH